MPTSIRLDPATEALLDRLARRSKRTRSDVVREAITRYAESVDAPAPDGGVCAYVEDLIGIAEGGPTDLARRHKRAFRDRLAERKKRR